jgi:hypothetical protein
MSNMKLCRKIVRDTPNRVFPCVLSPMKKYRVKLALFARDFTGILLQLVNFGNKNCAVNLDKI